MKIPTQHNIGDGVVVAVAALIGRCCAVVGVYEP